MTIAVAQRAAVPPIEMERRARDVGIDRRRCDGVHHNLTVEVVHNLPKPISASRYVVPWSAGIIEILYLCQVGGYAETFSGMATRHR